jgi:hypothetical protein
MEQKLKWFGAENEQLLRAGFYGQKKNKNIVVSPLKSGTISLL